jgi:hypothetical protein
MRRFLGFFCAALMLAMPTVAVAQNNSNLSASDKVMIDRIDANGVGTPGAISVYNLFNGIGIGYGTGGGGVVTQLTSRTTGVTLNTLSGQITLFSAAGSATAASFTVTDSAVGANDTINFSQKSGTNLYVVVATAVAAGSFQVTFFTTGGTATDAPVFTFAVIHAATS